MKNKQTENALRAHISNRNGWQIEDDGPRKNGENGADVIATDSSSVFLIEVIGYKKTGPARSKDFYEVFWRAISRLELDLNESPAINSSKELKLVIALPEQFLRGIRQRTKRYHTAWKRIAQAFPELEVWFVSEKGFDRHTWVELLSI